MNSPVFDEIENTNNTGKIIPIYPLTFSLTQNTLRKIIEKRNTRCKTTRWITRNITRIHIRKIQIRKNK